MNVTSGMLCRSCSKCLSNKFFMLVHYTVRFCMFRYILKLLTTAVLIHSSSELKGLTNPVAATGLYSVPALHESVNMNLGTNEICQTFQFDRSQWSSNLLSNPRGVQKIRILRFITWFAMPLSHARRFLRVRFLSLSAPFSADRCLLAVYNIVPITS